MALKKGQVIRVIAGFYDVKQNDNVYRLRASGNLRKQKNNPVVGDYVEFCEDGFLTKIFDRTNSLIRPKVANVDQAAIVISFNDPKFSSLLLDKFLAIVEFQNITPIIIFTKSDLVKDHQHYFDYKNQGYQCFLINNNDKNNEFEKIKNLLKNKLTVFMGQSGVGKSSAINNILGLTLSTNEISKALGRGKHTTRVVEIHYKNKISIIDTPGFGSISIELTPQQLATSFYDFRLWSKKCKFRSCLHENEKECNVKKQLENHKLLPSRYENYLKILEISKENYSIYE